MCHVLNIKRLCSLGGRENGARRERFQTELPCWQLLQRGLLGQAGRDRHGHERRPRREDQVQEVLECRAQCKGGASGDRRQGLEVTTAFINLTEVELRAALDRNRDLPKYLTGGIPIREVPLVTDPAQRETVFLFKAPRPTASGAHHTHAMAPIASGACWTRGIRSTAARATLC